MSRFMLIGAHEAPVTGGPRQRLAQGTTIADSAGNAQLGDLVCPQLCASPTSWMVALDASAVAAFAAIGITAAIGQRLQSAVGGP